MIHIFLKNRLCFFFITDHLIMSASQSEDLSMDQSSSSLPGTPMAMSNPGTPRSEVRNTPPPHQQLTNTQQQEQVRHTPPPVHGSSGYTPTIPTSLTSKPAPSASQQSQSKYAQLLNVIEDMGKDIRPTYSGSRTSSERLKRGIVHARILVRECLMECERAART